jgi:DNA primase
MKTNREGQQFNQYQQNKQGGSTVQLISTKQTGRVNSSTNINKTNREGQQFNQYQQNKQGGSTVQPISTKQTGRVNSSTNINKTNHHISP